MAQHELDATAKYAKSHEWVRMEDGIAVIGISDFAQDELSDVVYVDLPAVGTTVSAGQEIAVVESVKAAEDIVAPVSGVIVEVNSALESTPEIINQRPYSAWFFKITPTLALEEELAALLSPEDYAAFVEEAG